MSRIYEALQKAESEKNVERQADGLRMPVDEQVDAPATATIPYDEPMTFAGVGVEEPIPVSQSGGSLNTSAIGRLPWNPAVDRLPALLERGPAVEQFRSLRSRVYEARDIRPIKSILVSSGLPQEGKSFVSANLAVSLARHKSSKVLLIDGDMRRYTLHELLGTESHPGLAEYLAGKATVEQVMQRMVDDPAPNSINHILSNLTFIPGGNGGDKAADLSGNPRFGELLRLAAPYFDWIIVDSSPVVPVSDGVNLARSCDGVLLVARAGVTKYPVAQRAAAELRSANVLGFVLNAVIEGPQMSTYYGYNSSKE